jgi:hypothetical protein
MCLWLLPQYCTTQSTDLVPLCCWRLILYSFHVYNYYFQNFFIGRVGTGCSLGTTSLVLTAVWGATGSSAIRTEIRQNVVDISQRLMLLSGTLLKSSVCKTLQYVLDCDYFQQICSFVRQSIRCEHISLLAPCYCPFKRVIQKPVKICN